MHTRIGNLVPASTRRDTMNRGDSRQRATLWAPWRSRFSRARPAPGWPGEKRSGLRSVGPRAALALNRRLEMLFQQLPHLQASAPRTRLRYAWGDAERPGSFADRKALNVAKLENGPVCGRKPSDHLGENGVQFLLRVALFRIWLVILKLMKKSAAFSRNGIIQGNFFSATRPDLHQPFVDRDAPEPRKETGIAAEASHVLERLHEGVLLNVLSILAAVSKPLSDSENPGLVAFDQPLKGGGGPEPRRLKYSFFARVNGALIEGKQVGCLTGRLIQQFDLHLISPSLAAAN